jgi:hypothetical protein
MCFVCISGAVLGVEPSTLTTKKPGPGPLKGEYGVNAGKPGTNALPQPAGGPVPVPQNGTTLPESGTPCPAEQKSNAAKGAEFGLFPVLQLVLGHRTAGFVISPFCKRGVVDSTLYTTASMIRTMELILGLPPMTQFDAGATPMFNSFQKTCQATPFVVLTPEVNLLAKNTAKSPFAKQSAKMDFREYDEAPEDELNRILWAAARGTDAPYPTPIHRMLFAN